MSDLAIDVHWQRHTTSLAPGEYNTEHEIVFSRQHALTGDAAPDWGGNVNAANPEQAIAASLSSCHMMTFLALAAKAGWPVASYHDRAKATLGKTAQGRMAVTELTLTPRVCFDSGFAVSSDEMERMHHRAHRYCFIANSISATMTIAPVL